MQFIDFQSVSFARVELDRSLYCHVKVEKLKLSAASRNSNISTVPDKVMTGGKMEYKRLQAEVKRLQNENKTLKKERAEINEILKQIGQKSHDSCTLVSSCLGELRPKRPNDDNDIDELESLPLMKRMTLTRPVAPLTKEKEHENDVQPRNDYPDDVKFFSMRSLDISCT